MGIMSDIVIKAENIGKMYTIGHQAERSRYTALRDVLMQSARTLWSKTKDLAKGRPIIQGDTLEEFWALKDVSFEIRRGEAVGIIGRNGAGKSTLLKILSRITEPSTGRVTIKGRVASLLEVGTGFHPELTGRENIYLNGTILGMTRKEIKRKFDEIVSFAEVEKYLDTPVKRYSSGMYVRLAFAVAAYLEPEIMVVDEVLAVGDAAFQKKCLGKMGDVAIEGRTVLFVSHNMSAISMLCNSCMLISQGKMISVGNTDSIVNQYINIARNQEIELKERADRVGNGWARITDMYLRNKNKEKVVSVKIAEPFDIVIKLEAGDFAVERSIAFDIIIVDQKENRIVPLQNAVMGHKLFVCDKEEVFICYVEQGLPLVPGDYSITYSVKIAETTVDRMFSAINFTITADDFFGTNLLPKSSQGTVLIKTRWDKCYGKDDIK
jgi:lipopolysaccharide transport system ATP-binding protein